MFFIAENQRLKEKVLCKICMDGLPDIVYLPCCHVVVCKSCDSEVESCIECGKSVKSKFQAKRTSVVDAF